MNLNLENESRLVHQVIRVVDEIEALTENQAGFFGKRFVNEETFFAHTGRLKEMLPEAVSRATTIVQQGERILRESQDKYERTLREAEREAQRLREEGARSARRVNEDGEVQARRNLENGQSEAERLLQFARTEAAAMREEENVARLAQENADRLLQQTQVEADARREEARAYAAQVLAEVGQALERAFQEVTFGPGRQRPSD